MKLAGAERGTLSRQVTICNKLGLHARAAGKLRNLAETFSAKISVVRGHAVVDAKSVLGLMALEASKGTTLELRAAGADAEAALAALAALIEDRFGEGE